MSYPSQKFKYDAIIKWAPYNDTFISRILKISKKKLIIIILVD